MRPEDQYFLIIWGSIFTLGFAIRKFFPILRRNNIVGGSVTASDKSLEQQSDSNQLWAIAMTGTEMKTNVTATTATQTEEMRLLVETSRSRSVIFNLMKAKPRSTCRVSCNRPFKDDHHQNSSYVETSSGKEFSYRFCVNDPEVHRSINYDRK